MRKGKIKIKSGINAEYDQGYRNKLQKETKNPKKSEIKEEKEDHENNDLPLR
jgi:hypothetical protein